MLIRFIALAALATLVVPVAAQAPPAEVYCGSLTCFRLRVSAEGKTPDARAGHAMDVINKYLGGAVGKVTAKPAAKSVRLFLNNEPVLLVTSADADAEKEKSAAALAAKWSRSLSQAFEATKAKR